MAFERSRVFILEFEDEDLKGLEVRAKPASAGALMSAIELVDLTDRPNHSTKDLKEVDRLFRIFGGCPPECDWTHDDQGGNHLANKIVSWNLTQDGQEVPANYLGLMSEDLEFVMSMIGAWIEAQVGTPGELGKDSNSGGLSEEVSIPMELLSPVPSS
jgi:hypothetical protein